MVTRARRLALGNVGYESEHTPINNEPYVLPCDQRKIKAAILWCSRKSSPLWMFSWFHDSLHHASRKLDMKMAWSLGRGRNEGRSLVELFRSTSFCCSRQKSGMGYCATDGAGGGLRNSMY
jgi:hypothetical protein